MSLQKAGMLKKAKPTVLSCLLSCFGTVPNALQVWITVTLLR